MGEQLSSFPERMPMQQRLGAEQLDAAQREWLYNFVNDHAQWLGDQMAAEKQAAESGQAWEPRAIDVERLARSSTEPDRLLAASAMPEYVEQNPDSEYGYRLWERLLDDRDDEVAEQAGHFLLSALGRRVLDPVRILPVLDAYRSAYYRRWEKRRQERQNPE